MRASVIAVVTSVALVSTASAQLWNNGPFETSPGISALQTGQTIFGYGNQAPPTANSMGDDFVVSGGGWNVTDFNVFNYQTGAQTSPSTFTSVNMTIYSGAVGDTSNQVYTTSGLTNSVWTGVYRTDATGTGTLRPIFQNTVATPGLVLADGNYWVSWNVAGTLTSGPWAVPVTPAPLGANAMQQIGVAGAWATTNNGGLPDDMAFIFNGTIVPAPSSLALLGLGGLVACRRRR